MQRLYLIDWSYHRGGRERREANRSEDGGCGLLKMGKKEPSKMEKSR